MKRNKVYKTVTSSYDSGFAAGIITFLLTIISVIATIGICTWLWNWLIVGWFGAPTFTFWQMAGLKFVLFWMLPTGKLKWISE